LPVRKPKPSAPAALPIELNATQTALDARLRAWRKEQAHAIGLPSFFVFSDTVLRDIVFAAPTSLGALRSIRGLGADKLDRFGPAVIELCRE
jgi:superfamily II DNA helicase RecQ